MTKGLAILSGTLAWLAYPLAGLWPLIFVCYVPLMIAAGRESSGRRRFLLGWLTGVSMITVKHYFIAGTFVYFSGLPWAAAIPMFLAYVAYTGLGWGLFAWGYGHIRRLGGASWLGPAVVAAVWYGAVERWFPFIFPFYASSALYDVPLLLQFSDVIGSTGITACVLFVQCTLVHAVEQRRGQGSRWWLPPLAAAVCWVALVGYGVWSAPQYAAAGERGELTVSLVQPNATIDEKRDRSPKGRVMLYRRVVAMSLEAKAAGTDLIIWPEGAFPFAYKTEAVRKPKSKNDNIHTFHSRELIRLSQALKLPFVASGLRMGGGRVHNSALYFDGQSPEPSIYDKHLLLWFGERLPFAETFPQIVDWVPNASNHKAGEEFALYDVNGIRFGPNICYEALFPAFTRDGLNTGEGADVLLNLTNDVWFGSAQEAEHHLMVQVQRAIENRVWLVRSTNSGVSAFVNPAGQILARAETGERRVLTEKVSIGAHGWSVYRRVGDLMYYLAMVAAALWLGHRARRRSNAAP